MGFSDQSRILDDASRAFLCDPAEIRPAAGGEAVIAPVMVEEPVRPSAESLTGAPLLQATVEVMLEDHRLRKGDIVIPGREVAGVFVAGDRAWRVTGAPTRTGDGGWQTASIERYALEP